MLLSIQKCFMEPERPLKKELELQPVGQGKRAGVKCIII
jgi:hypothetical protein